jgi:starvation-inducible outer membrane lipoprotein
MHMKQRWIGVLLLALALALAACAPPDAGADDESAAPRVDAAPAATPVPDPDEY